MRGVASARLRFPNSGLNVIAGAKLTYSLLVARQTPIQVALGDEATPFQIVFDLAGEGKTLSKSGIELQDSKIYRLTDRWYLLTATFRVSQPRVLPTLTLISNNASSDAFVDVGWMRIDKN